MGAKFLVVQGLGLSFHCGGAVSIPGQVTRILGSVPVAAKKKRKEGMPVLGSLCRIVVGVIRHTAR